MQAGVGCEKVIRAKTHSHCHFVIGIVNGLTLKIIAVEPASSTKLHENNNKSIMLRLHICKAKKFKKYCHICNKRTRCSMNRWFGRREFTVKIYGKKVTTHWRNCATFCGARRSPVRYRKTAHVSLSLFFHAMRLFLFLREMPKQRQYVGI